MKKKRRFLPRRIAENLNIFQEQFLLHSIFRLSEASVDLLFQQFSHVSDWPIFLFLLLFTRRSFIRSPRFPSSSPHYSLLSSKMIAF